jgi:type II secretory pathway predicted ATPase ExeA/phage tail protein X
MFLNFYQLREQPFGVTPDPRYLYFSPAHREALASLYYGIEMGRGFLALIAQPGMGKTTLLFQLLERLKGSDHTAFLFQTQCNSRELLRSVLDALGLGNHGHDFVLMHAQLNEFLFRDALAGRRVVLVIDEAQNLSDSALETVRLLSDFEAPNRKLLQIVLAGHPELAQRLSSPGLGQLRQRIAVLKGLAALPAAETARYINHRLQVAKYHGPELFTPAALALIAERSQGIPRSINNICFNALSLGCAMGRKKIGSEIVLEAAADLSLESILPQPPAVRSSKPAIPAMPQPSGSPATAARLKGRPFQIAAFAAVIASLMIYVGEHNKARLAAPSPPIPQVSLNTEGASDSEIASSPLPPGVPLGVSRNTFGRTDPSEDSSASFTYVVQPHDTLRSLCMRFIGRYDDSVLAEIRKLNQGLTDPNHLEVGLEVRLPSTPPIQGNATSNGEQLRNPN